ncbi:DUF167 domain-containing protein [Patescibacteria group bacterium]|nr:DUF167 domain-containing protein [Candidatus Falkowbacteria bacterium]MBU3905459.1 DUF167 domain-containing protein [Patescibacteria group bacterium]MBU4015310.1 DUF167 domain-containing protein [Patescibacteria group bacterium]MBU4026026.1 DUF167 domain-containing protein [Patescibacteria group bacterium]MBU4073003.1 DUF167 domain-containing protein [Patescibacteria group bacterium]
MPLLEFKKQLKNKKEVYLRVKARPNSAKSEIGELMSDETVKINIAALPVKGKANQELIKFLAREFEVDKNNIKIISGARERIKLVKILR